MQAALLIAPRHPVRWIDANDNGIANCGELMPVCFEPTFRENFYKETGADMYHTSLRALASLTICLIVAQFAAAQEIKPENHTVTARDGWPIHFTYYPSTKGKDAGVVVLLHGLIGENRNRVEWDAVALGSRLSKDEFAVIAVDLRKHGDSKAPEDAPARIRSAKVSKFDYIAMVELDLEAIKKFIYTEHQGKKLNMRKTAIVAADASSVLAVNFAARDWLKKPHNDAPVLTAQTPRGQDILAIVLLSPEESLTGLNTSKPLKVLKPFGVASLFIYGEKNTKDARVAGKLYKQFGGDSQPKDNLRIYKTGYNSKLRGVDIVKIKAAPNSPSPTDYIIGFLRNHLKDLEIPWKNRESRITRPKEE
jgi:alpha-beta hydrolase superfamily lysophospholipase